MGDYVKSVAKTVLTYTKGYQKIIFCHIANGILLKNKTCERWILVNRLLRSVATGPALEKSLSAATELAMIGRYRMATSYTIGYSDLRTSHTWKCYVHDH